MGGISGKFRVQGPGCIWLKFSGKFRVQGPGCIWLKSLVGVLDRCTSVQKTFSTGTC